MNRFLNYFIAAVFLVQSVSPLAFAEEGEVHVCSDCVRTDARPGDVVEHNGERWVLDHEKTVEGRTSWYAERQGPAQGRTMGEGGVNGPVGGVSSGAGAGSQNEGRDIGARADRITGHDFSDYEDSREASKKEREELAQYREKIIARLNQETVADAGATEKELSSELQDLKTAVDKSASVAAGGPQLPPPFVDSVDAVASALGSDPQNPDVSAADAGWAAYDDHPFVSNHKEILGTLRNRLNNSVPKSPQQADAKLTGYVVLNQSDEAFAGDDPGMGNQLLQIGRVLVDIATDVIPVTSIPKDFYRVVVGKDPATGEPIQNWERYLAAGFIVLTVGTAGGSNLFTPELRALAKAANLGEKDLALAARLSETSVVKFGAELVGKTKGWLKDVRIGDAVAHNQHLKDVRHYTELAWDASKPMIWGTTSTEKSFVRFIGPSSRPAGSWITDIDRLIGKSPKEIEKILALSYTPTHAVRVTVPSGVEMSAGFVGRNAFGGGTGAVQYFVEKVDPVAFGKAVEIGKTFGGGL